MGLFSGSSKQQTQVDPMRRDLTVDWQNRMYGLSQRPFEFFPDQTYAEMDPLQEEALQMREQYGRGMQGMVDPAMQAWQSTLSAPDVASNPYVQGMLEQQANLLNRNLMENLIPGAEMGAIGAGQFGGSRQGIAEGIAMRGTQEALANQAAQTQMDAYLAGLGQQRYGLSAAPGMASFGMMPADVLSGVGGVRRGEEQKAIDEARQRWEFEQNEPWMRAERFAGSFFPYSQPYSTTTREAQTTPSAFSVGTQLAGLGLAGMGMFGPMGGGGGYAGSGSVPMPDPGAGFGPMQQMQGMGALGPRMGMYNPMQYGYGRPY